MLTKMNLLYYISLDLWKLDQKASTGLIHWKNTPCITIFRRNYASQLNWIFSYTALYLYNPTFMRYQLNVLWNRTVQLITKHRVYYIIKNILLRKYFKKCSTGSIEFEVKFTNSFFFLNQVHLYNNTIILTVKQPIQ